VTVALAGDGGDEIFAGYPTYQAHKLAAYFDRLPRWAVRSFAGLVERLPVSLDNFSLDFKLKKFCSGLGLPDHRRNTVWLGSFAPEGIRDLLVPGLVSGTDDPFRLVDSRLEGTSLSGTLSRILRFDMKTYLTDDILVKADRASMSCSLEARSPFLDHRVVEFASSLPVDYLLHGWTTKWILKTSMKGILPDDVIRRKKKGFGIPVGYWLKNQLRGLAGDLLSPDRIRRQGLFDPDRITRLFEEHLQGVRDNRKPLWTLMAFQLWYDSWGSASGR
jgi:asparagine synthase (glutamine-hydrolysing)